MKKIVCMAISTLTILSANFASASTPDQVSVPPPGFGGIVTLTPVRQARYQATIYKQTEQTAPDGTVNSSAEIICQKTGTIPVFDARPAQVPGSGGYAYQGGEMARCPAVVGGKNVTLLLDSLIMIARGAGGFSEETDTKGFSTTLYAYASPTDNSRPVSLGQSQMITRDLGLSEINSSLVSTSVAGENLSVFYDIQDEAN